MNRPLQTTAIPLLFLVQAILLVSCWGYRQKPPDMVRPEAYVPVYGYDSVGRTIKSMDPQPTTSAGKIYAYGNYVFQVEEMKGVHIIDHSDKLYPVKLGFVASKGCTEVAMKNGFLIVNNFDDLVTIDLRDMNDVKEAGRIKKAFTNYTVYLYQSKPPVENQWFVCPELDKGDILRWELKKNVNGAGCHN